MAKRTVTTPSGEVWHVRRLWAPRLQQERLWTRLRRRLRRTRRISDVVDGPDIGFLDLFDDAFAVIGLVVAVVVLGVILVFFVVPLLVALVDLLFVVAVSLVGIVSRVVFRRPWVVEAVDSDGTRHTWRVVGRRDSRDAVDAIADAFVHGHVPPAPVGATAWPPPGATPGATPGGVLPES